MQWKIPVITPLIDSINKLSKRSKQWILIELILAVLIYVSFKIISKFVLPELLIYNSFILQKGFRDTFVQPFEFRFLIAFGTLIGVLFAYVSIPVFLYFLVKEPKNQRKNIINELIETSATIRKKHGNWFFLILTITISVSLIYAGRLFLATAFPAEPLFLGIKGTYDSKLTCSQGYLNLISTWDVPCTVELANKFMNMTPDRAEFAYYINRTEYRENVSWTDKKHITLYYDKIKQPQFLYLWFENDTQEVFAINIAGVYTKEEYFAREKDKAIWFFGIISMSIFSVFSAMANVKQIMEKTK